MRCRYSKNVPNVDPRKYLSKIETWNQGEAKNLDLVNLARSFLLIFSFNNYYLPIYTQNSPDTPTLLGLTMKRDCNKGIFESVNFVLTLELINIQNQCFIPTSLRGLCSPVSYFMWVISYLKVMKTIKRYSYFRYYTTTMLMLRKMCRRWENKLVVYSQSLSKQAFLQNNYNKWSFLSVSIISINHSKN